MGGWGVERPKEGLAVGLTGHHHADEERLMAQSVEPNVPDHPSHNQDLLIPLNSWHMLTEEVRAWLNRPNGIPPLSVPSVVSGTERTPVTTGVRE